MRRWKVIDGGGMFLTGEIVFLGGDPRTRVPFMRKQGGHRFWGIGTHQLVEIDENGNTIRTYKKGDKLDEGTLVRGTMDKNKAMERLDAIEAEAKALRELIDTPDKIVYDYHKLYVLEFRGSGGGAWTHILLGVVGEFTWYSLFSTEQTFNGLKYGCQQDALDCVLGRDDCTIHAFTSRDDALKFIMECK